MADWYFRNANSGLKTCPGCGKLVKNVEEFCPYCAKRLRGESGIRGKIRHLLAQRFIMTRILLGTLVVVFMLQLIADLLLPGQYRSGRGGGLMSLLAADGLTYVRMGSSYHPLVRYANEYWRLLTYCFLHAGAVHILFNGYALWTLGQLVETMWGKKQLVATFILTGITGGLASYLWNVGSFPPVNSLGASGAICGFLGLLLGAFYRNRYHVGEYLGSQLVRWVVYLLVFGLVMGADNGAHIGGMLGGAALGYFLHPTASTRTLTRDMKIWNAAAVVSVILLVVCVGFAINFYLQGPDVLHKMGLR